VTACPHGEDAAFCWDALNDQQRGVFDALFEHAYDWVIYSVTVDREVAEEYALWYAKDNLPAGITDASRHDLDAFERWRSEQYAKRHRS
jgi:hypothetical protein